MIFKNVTSKTLECYGYRFEVNGPAVDVKEPDLIRKFSLYHQLVTLDTGEPDTNVEVETHKSQAIAQGMKVDGRWNAERLEREVKAYLSEANGD